MAFPFLVIISQVRILWTTSSRVLSTVVSRTPLVTSFTLSAPFSSRVCTSTTFSDNSFIFYGIVDTTGNSDPFSFTVITQMHHFKQCKQCESSATADISTTEVYFFGSSIDFPYSSVLRVAYSFFSSEFLGCAERSCDFLDYSSFDSPITSFLCLRVGKVMLPSSVDYATTSVYRHFASDSSIDL